MLTLSKWILLCAAGLLVACSPKQDPVEETVPQPSENVAMPSSKTDASTEDLESGAYSASKPLDLSLPEDLDWEQDEELVNPQPRQFDLDGLFNKDDESTMSHLCSSHPEAVRGRGVSARSRRGVSIDHS